VISFDTLCASYRMGEACRRKVVAGDWLECPDRPTDPTLEDMLAYVATRPELIAERAVLVALHREWRTGHVVKLDDKPRQYSGRSEYAKSGYRYGRGG